MASVAFTNRLLLAFIVAATVSGGVALVVGGALSGPITIVHAVTGLGLLFLARPKSRIAKRGLKRRKRHVFLSVLLVILTLLTLATGVAHSSGLELVAPDLLLRLHIGCAIGAVMLITAHVFMRHAGPGRVDSRRQVLRAAAIGAEASVLWGAQRGIAPMISSRAADRRASGSIELQDGDALLATNWLFDQTPTIEAEGFAVTIDCPIEAVGRTRVLVTPAELDAFGDTVVATLDCTSGWYAKRQWSGARLDRLVTPDEDARSIDVISVTGYHRRFPMHDLPRLLLAVRLEGELLRPGNGAPVRLVAPNRRGFWWVKWVREVRLSSTPWWFQEPIPMQ